MLLQLTDCHLLEQTGERLLNVATDETFTAVLEQALAEATPELLLLSGDLAHTPTQSTYRRRLALVRARYRGPLAVVPGNHDAVAPLAAVFDAVPAGDRLIEHRLGGCTLVLLSSAGDGGPEAVVGEAARQALVDRCAALTHPLVLVLHHPLLPVGTPWLDKDCVPAGARLLEQLRTVADLRGVVFGHVHQPVCKQHDGVLLLGTPSTCFQFAPGSQAFSLTAEQPGYRWISYDHKHGLSTRLRRLSEPRIVVEPRFLRADNPVAHASE
ncbi:MAG: metallophosphoesterase [Pseudomonadota bacterium]